MKEKAHRIMTKKKGNFNSPIAPLPEPEQIDAAGVLQSYLDGEIDLICVLGPTASGKTRYAVQLAREFNRLCRDGAGNLPGQNAPAAEIISADSRQFYRGMDIGTGKDLEEYEEIPYHLIDICPAGYRYNIYQYQQDFEKVYADLRERHRIPILCGGSGLYIKAAVEAYFSTTAQKLKVYYIGTLVSREERVRRIDRRLDARLEEGMVEEIRGLLDSGIAAEDLIYYGLEYKYVTLYVTGELTYDEMRTQLAHEIHRFAKRQMTWFRSLEKQGTLIHWTQI